MGNKLGVEKREEPESEKGFPDLNKTMDQIWNEVDGALPRQVTAVLVGAGWRVTNYADFGLDFPSRLKIVGVAEPKAHRREKVKENHEISTEYAVDDWTKLAAFDKLADLAIISTQDHLHRDPAVAFAEKGYHLLLEKPMALHENQCEEIAEACQKNDVQ